MDYNGCTLCNYDVCTTLRLPFMLFMSTVFLQVYTVELCYEKPTLPTLL